MKKTNISYMKNHLSELLNCVREGESVLIVDRHTPIARLERVTTNTDADAQTAQLVREGILRPPRHKPDAAGLDALPLPAPTGKGNILRALLKDREESW